MEHLASFYDSSLYRFDEAGVSSDEMKMTSQNEKANLLTASSTAQKPQTTNDHEHHSRSVNYVIPDQPSPRERPNKAPEVKRLSSQLSRECFLNTSESRSNFRDVIVDWWIYEVAACAVSFAAFFSIVGVLKHYEGRSQPEWPWSITINSVISWCTTVMEACLLVSVTACISQATWAHFRAKPQTLVDIDVHDSASRGPMGSLRLLLTFKAKYIANFAALITILAIGIDPTTQQALAIKSISANSSASVATLGRAQAFLNYTGSENEAGISLPTSAMVGSIYTGMFFGSSKSKSQFLDPVTTCPTGNCTFPAFQSLAVCSSCKDLTPSINETCHNATLDYGEGPRSRRIYCQLSLKNGLKVNLTDMDNIYGATAASGFLPPVSSSEFGDSLLNFSIIRGPRENQDGDVVRQSSAAQCSLFWCVNTYSARVKNGQLEETLLKTFHDNATNWLTGRTMNARRLELIPPSQYVPSSKFIVGYIASQGLTSWLAPKLSFSNSLAAFVDEGMLSTGADSSSNITSAQQIETVDTMRIFRDAPSLDGLFSTLAKAMTTQIRNVEPTFQNDSNGYIPPVAGIGPANGTSTFNEVVVAVRWKWLSFPGTILGLTALCLALTILETARHTTKVWKSSPIPLLFHGLEQEQLEQDGVGQTRTLAEMEALASGMTVQLRDEGDGYKLRA